MFKKILIANRGVIAVRIQGACRELGIKTVAVYTPEDENSLHVKNADEKICIRKYDEIPEIIAVAEHFKVDGVHPGFGFLSENSDFVDVVNRYSKFIGPSLDSIELMGDKVRARIMAKEAGVPITPGSEGAVISEKRAIEIADDIGFPLIIKATSGGGGMGLVEVYEKESLRPSLRRVQEEAKQLFGNSEVYIERLITNKRHIEVQILADNYGNVVHLFERDCSLQRRKQKLFEYSPAFIDSEKKNQLTSSAVRLAKYMNYTNVGTIEYLFDEHNDFYFMEANTRIQVEHRVTELVTGIDLIKEQIKLAYGEKLKYKQENIMPKGFAIECRINSEDCDNEFESCPGILTRFIPPEGKYLVVDTYIPKIDGTEEKYQIPVSYDSLFANVIVWGETKKDAVEKMKSALLEFIIEGEGVKTTIPFHLRHLEEF